MARDLIRVAVCGAAGRMGREVVRAISEQPDMALAAAIDCANAGADSGELAGVAFNGILIETDLDAALKRAHVSVLVDFTLPTSVGANIKMALANRVPTVVGATGLSPADLAEIEKLSNVAGTPVFVAPNFAIGAVLMMQFASMAARYMPDVEIIELHHENKLDSPSGTAILTAQRIAEARRSSGIPPAPVPASMVEKAPGARGARGAATGDVTIHSVRLRGLVAHQEVIFGGQGQTLTIRHDSLDRNSFMPGVMLAVRKAAGLQGLVVGLEHLL